MNVNFYANFRSLVGGKTVVLELPSGSRVTQVLSALRERYPALAPHLTQDDGDLHRHVRLFINGRDLEYLPDGLETMLSGDEKIDIFPPIGGGASVQGAGGF